MTLKTFLVRNKTATFKEAKIDGTGRQVPEYFSGASLLEAIKQGELEWAKEESLKKKVLCTANSEEMFLLYADSITMMSTNIFKIR